jgi:mannose-6-phosphate isomerase-like protein (cupin superfamily)
MRRTYRSPYAKRLAQRRATRIRDSSYGPVMHAFGVSSAVDRLRSAGGGYEIVHESAGLELGVYVLVAPEADNQQPHADDEIYIGLEGTGVLEVGGERIPIDVGEAIFVEAGVEHRFTAYEQLAVLVIFERARG